MSADSHNPTGESDSPDSPVSNDNGDQDGPSPQYDSVEPLTLSLVGRFFGVPMLIIGSIVGGAVVVVALFGAPTAPRQHSVDELLQALEASSGERTMGMLLPKEKELWQTGLELTTLLKNGDDTLEQDDLRTIALRVGAMVERDLESYGANPPSRQGGGSVTTGRLKRMQFLTLALGLSGQPEAIRPLISVVREGVEELATVGMIQLGNLADLPDARLGIVPIVERLGVWERAEAKLVACTVLSVLAKPSDTAVIDALAKLRLSSAGEVEWAAALALARLGSSEAKLTLLDLLDRSFWETGDRYRHVDEHGAERNYPMPPQKVEGWLVASIDAVSHLADAGLWKQIERLKSDSSPMVRSRAQKALGERVGQPATSAGA